MEASAGCAPTEALLDRLCPGRAPVLHSPCANSGYWIKRGTLIRSIRPQGHAAARCVTGLQDPDLAGVLHGWPCRQSVLKAKQGQTQDGRRIRVF